MATRGLARRQKKEGEYAMLKQCALGAITLAAALCVIGLGAPAAELKYPDLSGEWHGSGNRWPTNPPLMPEYQAVWEANKRDHSSGGSPTLTCLPPGMPRQASVYEPMEIIITPKTVYQLTEHNTDYRQN